MTLRLVFKIKLEELGSWSRGTVLDWSGRLDSGIKSLVYGGLRDWNSHLVTESLIIRLVTKVEILDRRTSGQRHTASFGGQHLWSEVVPSYWS